MKSRPHPSAARRRLAVERIVCNVAAIAAVATIFAGKAMEAERIAAERRIEVASRDDR